MNSVDRLKSFTFRKSVFNLLRKSQRYYSAKSTISGLKFFASQT